MDTHLIQAPTVTPGAVKETSWRSSASGISCLYVTTLLAVYGLAIGLTVIFMETPAALKVALLEHASVSRQIELAHWDANTPEAGQRSGTTSTVLVTPIDRGPTAKQRAPR